MSRKSPKNAKNGLKLVPFAPKQAAETSPSPVYHADPEVVEALDQLTNLARQGQLTGLVTLGLAADGSLTSMVYVPVADIALTLIGALAVVQKNLIEPVK